MLEETETRRKYEESEALATGMIRSAENMPATTTRASSETMGNNWSRCLIPATPGNNSGILMKGTRPTIRHGRTQQAAMIDFIPPVQIHAPPSSSVSGRSIGCQRSSAETSVFTQDYFDAVGGHTIAANPQLYKHHVDEDERTDNGVPQQIHRGGKCPVQGANLVTSGDQVYARYLQQPHPLTNDVILSRGGSGYSTKCNNKRGTEGNRIGSGYSMKCYNSLARLWTSKVWKCDHLVQPLLLSSHERSGSIGIEGGIRGKIT